MMRVRCSNGLSAFPSRFSRFLIWLPGLKVAEQYGNFYKRSKTDLEFGVLDADKSITVLFGHTSTLDERQYAHIQSAVLYTTATGQRMVRTCNMALPVVTLAMNVFRYVDADAAVAYWFRKGGYFCHWKEGLEAYVNVRSGIAISKISTKPMDHLRDDLMETCTATLLGYRRDCAQTSAITQVRQWNLRSSTFLTLKVHRSWLFLKHSGGFRFILSQ